MRPVDELSCRSVELFRLAPGCEQLDSVGLPEVDVEEIREFKQTRSRTLEGVLKDGGR